MASKEAVEVTHEGGCHCGAIRFKVKAPENVSVCKCNCSVCVMKQNWHFIVPNSKFELLRGEEKLTSYRFGSRVAKHTFCSLCGVQSFYSPRSNPDGKGIMPHCIAGNTIKSVHYFTFNGQNWEKEIQVRDDVVNMSKS